MTKEERDTVLLLARQSVEAAVRGEKFPEVPESKILDGPGGAFVTLKIRGRLRGCIGHFSGLGTLGETIRAMAREAAVGDPRFMAVQPDELDAITVEVSVLSPMQRISAEDVVPGLHGLYIRRGPRAGTLLPQVAAEENWERKQFLSHTCMKAGLPSDAWLDRETEIYAYTAEVFSEQTE